MNKEMIIKAWKNEQYRHTLSVNEQASLPAHPAGLVDLDDAGLGDVSGATWSWCAPIGISYLVCASLLLGTCGAATRGCCGEIE